MKYAVSSRRSQTRRPTACGAGEQIRFAADRLSYPQAACAEDLYKVADRLCAGNRVAADVAWLRELVQTMVPHPYENSENLAANLLRLAVASISRPAIVHRNARPVRQRMLALPPLD